MKKIDDLQIFKITVFTRQSSLSFSEDKIFSENNHGQEYKKHR